MENEIRKRMQGKVLLDQLIVLLSIILIFELSFPFLKEVHCPFFFFEQFVMAYCLFRTLYYINHRWISSLLIVVLAFICAHELFLGFSQLIENFRNIKAQDVCVGSFSNSGPYACFLAVCCSLFVVVYVKESKAVIKSILAILVLISFILLTCTLSRAAIISLSISMFLLILKNNNMVVLIRKYWIYILISFILLGIGTYLIKKPSADGRFLMARINLKMIRENGLTGIGFGNYCGEYGRTQARFFSEFMKDSVDDMDISNIPEGLRMVADCPRFSFNEYLKMGVENGPIAMLLMVGIMLLGIVQTYKSNSIWCYPLVVLSVFACFSYPFEVDILLLITIICLASNNNQQSNNLGGLFLLVFLVVLFGSVYYVRKERMYRNDIKAYSSFYSKMFRNRSKLYYIHDTDVIPEGIYHESMLFNYGQSLSENGEYTRSDSVLKMGTKISSDPMFWNVMGNNSLAQGKYREAEERYKHAFYMVPNRLYPLYLLAKLYHTEGDTVKFLDMADKVETFIPKVESVNTERLRNEIRELKSGYISEQYE